VIFKTAALNRYSNGGARFASNGKVGCCPSGRGSARLPFGCHRLRFRASLGGFGQHGCRDSFDENTYSI